MNWTSRFLWLVLFVAIVWPPVFFLMVSRRDPPDAIQHGEMQDYELQKLLNASRWVIDIPADKDGWYLNLSCKEEDKSFRTGGVSVRGGSTIVLLARRNTFEHEIEYVWYETSRAEQKQSVGPVTFTLTSSASGGGHIPDPLPPGSVTSIRPDGKVSNGDALYRGAMKELQTHPLNSPADFEVRLELSPPAEGDDVEPENDGQ
ncbi:MAG: hypothetical protein KDA88_01935 [Planctomycetaceae bacterium]|nr:hypothetical protein [Planctomycetaceae bacterium]